MQKIKEYYSSLKNYQKIELILLPFIIVIYLIYVFIYKEQTIIEQPIPLKQELITHQKIQNPDELKLNKVKNSDLVVIKQLENISKRYAIKLISLENQPDGVSFSLKGGFKGTMNFIYEVEKKRVFDELEIKLCENNKSLCCNGKVTFDTYEAIFNYPELLRELDLLNNPFIVNKSKDKNEIKHKIKIKAILENEVLIDKEYIKIGQSYKGYKLIKIGKRYVEFIYNNKTIRLEI